MKPFLKHIFVILYITIIYLACNLILSIQHEYSLLISSLSLILIYKIFQEVLNYFTATISVMLLVLSFPPFNLYHLSFLIIISTIYLIQHNKNYRNTIYYGIVSSIYCLLSGFSWLYNTIFTYSGLEEHVSIIVFLLSFIILTIEFPLIYLLLKYFNLRINTYSFVFLSPVIITFIDKLTYKLFPWYIGNSQFDNLYFIQLSDIIGVDGLTYIVILISVMLYLLLQTLIKMSKREIFKNLLILSVIQLCIYFYGYIQIDSIENDYLKNQTLNVSYIQTDRKVNCKGYELISECQEQNNKSADLIILPEGGFSSNEIINNKKLAETILKKEDSYILKQSVVILPDREGLDFILSLKDIFNNFMFRDYAYNHIEYKNYIASQLINYNGEICDSYYKNILIPFSENIPLSQKIKEYLNLSLDSFSSGNLLKTITMNDIKIAVILCYESLYSELSRKLIISGANLIVNQTNDSWFSEKIEKYQHLSFSRFRAIENRRTVIRVANSGISAIILPTGKINYCKTSCENNVEICDGQFNGNYFHNDNIILKNELTFYCLYGDLYLFLILSMNVLFVLYFEKKLL